MNEVKKPKKPLIYYYGIVLLIVILFNSIVMPMFLERQVKEVDYGTFMTMIGRVMVKRPRKMEPESIFTSLFAIALLLAVDACRLYHTTTRKR